MDCYFPSKATAGITNPTQRYTDDHSFSSSAYMLCFTVWTETKKIAQGN